MHLALGEILHFYLRMRLHKNQSLSLGHPCLPWHRQMSAQEGRAERGVLDLQKGRETHSMGNHSESKRAGFRAQKMEGF